MHLWLLFCISLVATLQALTVGQQLEKAPAGDYVVYAHQREQTFFRIAVNDDDELAIEEVTIPDRYAPKDWPAYLQQGAPQASSWTVSRFDKPALKLQEIRAYPHGELLSPDSGISLLPSLFALEMQPISDSARLRVGLPPSTDEPDRRKIWNPPVIYDGNDLHAPCSAFIVRHEGHDVELYFCPDSPVNALPYWIDVHAATRLTFRAMDSGSCEHSPSEASSAGSGDSSTS